MAPKKLTYIFLSVSTQQKHKLVRIIYASCLSLYAKEEMLFYWSVVVCHQHVSTSYVCIYLSRYIHIRSTTTTKCKRKHSVNLHSVLAGRRTSPRHKLFSSACTHFFLFLLSCLFFRSRFHSLRRV